MAVKFENSKTDGVHFHLTRLEGNWAGVTKVWFEPDKVADESPIQGTMRLILDGRFIMHEYKGSFGGKALEGIMIIGYHLGLEQYQSAWVDSFHNGTAIMFSQGERKETAFSMLGSYAYVTPEAEQHWGWRTQFELINDGQLLITAYNISPEGHEVKAMETLYSRQ